MCVLRKTDHLGNGVYGQALVELCADDLMVDSTAANEMQRTVAELLPVASTVGHEHFALNTR